MGWGKEDVSVSTGETAFLSWNEETDPSATHPFCKHKCSALGQATPSQVTQQNDKGGFQLSAKKLPLSHYITWN